RSGTQADCALSDECSAETDELGSAQNTGDQPPEVTCRERQRRPGARRCPRKLASGHFRFCSHIATGLRARKRWNCGCRIRSAAQERSGTLNHREGRGCRGRAPVLWEEVFECAFGAVGECGSFGCACTGGG